MVAVFPWIPQHSLYEPHNFETTRNLTNKLRWYFQVTKLQHIHPIGVGEHFLPGHQYPRQMPWSGTIATTWKHHNEEVLILGVPSVGKQRSRVFGDGQTFRRKVELILVGSNRADITNSRKTHVCKPWRVQTCFENIYYIYITSRQHIHIYICVTVLVLRSGSVLQVQGCLITWVYSIIQKFT